MVAICTNNAASEFDARRTQHLVRPNLRIDRVIGGCRNVLGEADGAAAADAATERAQAVDGRRAVPLEAAAFASGCGLGRLVQRAANVPSRCSSAFEVFCAAGSDEPLVVPGAAA